MIIIWFIIWGSGRRGLCTAYPRCIRRSSRAPGSRLSSFSRCSVYLTPPLLFLRLCRQPLYTVEFVVGHAGVKGIDQALDLVWRLLIADLSLQHQWQHVLSGDEDPFVVVLAQLHPVFDPPNLLLRRDLPQRIQRHLNNIYDCNKLLNQYIIPMYRPAPLYDRNRRSTPSLHLRCLYSSLSSAECPSQYSPWCVCSRPSDPQGPSNLYLIYHTSWRSLISPFWSSFGLAWFPLPS